MGRTLRIIVTYDSEPPRIFERRVEAPVGDVVAAISVGACAFNNAFEDELGRIKRQSDEEADTYSETRAA